MIIAIDGPAASGKGTLGRRLAEHYGFHHLDTGLLYRAVAAALLEAGDPLDDEAIAVSTTHRIPLEGLHGDNLASHAIGEAASRVAVMPGLRAALVDRQRAFAARTPGAVLDGRDVGTVICPDAEVKIFLVASPQARARRRAVQLGLHSAEGYNKVLEDIIRRDERDMNRAVAPLRPAADAHLLDTTDLDIEAAFQAALSIVEKAAERS